MSLENINCPQFVDFTSKMTFEINDGADIFFDRGIVGELDLGGFSFLKINPEPVKSLNQSPNILKESNKINNEINQVKKLTPKQPIQVIEKIPVKNDENKPGFVKKTIAKMGAALMSKQIKPPIIQPKPVATENIPPRPRNLSASKPVKSLEDHKIVRAPPLDLNRVRTFSKNETIIIDVPAKQTRQSRPRNPIDQCVNKSYQPSILQRPSSADRSKVPLPMYQGIKFVPKSQLLSKPPSVKSSIENITESLKSRPASLTRGFQKNLNSTPMRLKNELNSSNASLNGSKLRSGSGSGILHTELRAYKRLEYERFQREKDRIASIKKKDLESSRIQNERDEIKKIRSNSIVRSNPIKHYKPLVIRPSSKPLTNPVSPNLSARSFCLNH